MPSLLIWRDRIFVRFWGLILEVCILLWLFLIPFLEKTDIANIYSYLDGKKVVDEVIARVMAELDTDNYSSMLQIADSLQALFSNVKIEAEKYGAELQNAKQNANQLLTDVYTLQNETYKDIYPRYS